MELSEKKKKALTSFRKAQSHLAKVIQMTESGEYCVDVMQQNLAVIGLLKSAHQLLMENHLNSCFINAMESSSTAKKNKMVGEILQVTKLYNK